MIEYNITHHYTGHSDILATTSTLEEARAILQELKDTWELSPDDQFLELWSTDGEYNFTEIEDHMLIDPDDWYCDD